MGKKRGNRDDFIKTFVNQMYGILIGIGIGSILFDSAFDISDWYNIVMVVFVTSIVVIYWWDWIEYIEDEISSSKNEIIVDFIILISLEMLFVYYNRPRQLAVVLIILAVADLIWVLNHLRDIKKSKTEFKSNARNKKWIMEKITSIIIYSGLLAIVVYGIEELNLGFSKLLVPPLFIATFFITRKVSFNELFRASLYSIRPAVDIDVSEIAKLNNDFFLREDNKLLKKYTTQEIMDFIKTKNILIAVNNKSLIVGYLLTSNKGSFDYVEKSEYYDDTYKDLLVNQGYTMIDQIAVNNDFKREGIATMLLDELFKSSENIFTSYIAKEPENNDVSIAFHQKNGFIEVAEFNSKLFMGRNNYKSGLFFYSKN